MWLDADALLGCRRNREKKRKAKGGGEKKKPPSQEKGRHCPLNRHMRFACAPWKRIFRNIEKDGGHEGEDWIIELKVQPGVGVARGGPPGDITVHCRLSP